MIRPKTIDAVAAAVGQCAAVLPVGARSSLTGGATPSGDVVISTERLTALRIHGDRVTVGAEVALATLQDASPARHVAAAGADVSGRDSWRRDFDQRRGCRDVQMRSDAAVGSGAHAGAGEWRGAVVVTRRGDGVVGPPLCHRHGRGPRQVEVPALQMPAVPKRSAGYHCAEGMDLVDLFIGAEGTLGVVVEAELRLQPRPAGVCWLMTPLAARTPPCARRRSARAARASVAHRPIGGAGRRRDRAHRSPLAGRRARGRRRPASRHRVGERSASCRWHRSIVGQALRRDVGRSRRGARRHRRHADDGCRLLDRHGVLGRRRSCCPPTPRVPLLSSSCAKRARGRQSPRGVVERPTAGFPKPPPT